MFDNKEKKKGFKEFLKTQRLYIALAICVLALGGAVYFALSSGGTSGETENVQNDQGKTLEEEINQSSKPIASSVTSDGQAATTTGVSPEVSQEVEDANTSAATTNNNSNSGKTVIYLTMPVKGGQVIQEFSGEKMVYNKTLNMWSTHNGVDISAKTGDTVLAALAGTVKKVEMDNTMGWVVEIEHSNNQVTRYAGLSEATVKKGDKVNAGQTIGKAGTPPFEADLGVHVHFEYLVNGKYVDPATKLSTGS